MVVGFKLLVDPTYTEVYSAVTKVLNSGSDYVIYNDLKKLKTGVSSRVAFNKKMNFTTIENANDFAAFILKKHSCHILPPPIE